MLTADQMELIRVVSLICMAAGAAGILASLPFAIRDARRWLRKRKMHREMEAWLLKEMQKAAVITTPTRIRIEEVRDHAPR